jgi:hypothetical protein
MSTHGPIYELDAITNADRIVTRSCADVLRGFSKKVALFTPALLLTHGGFDRDPVTEFDARFPVEDADSRPFCIDLKPDTNEFFFSGLGVRRLPGYPLPVNWDKRVYGVDKEREEECFAFLSGIAFSDPKTGFFASVFAYDITIPDPTSWFNETLVVKVLGVISNKFITMLEKRLTGPAGVRQIPVPSATAALGFLQQNGILSPFTENDPLDIRE